MCAAQGEAQDLKVYGKTKLIFTNVIPAIEYHKRLKFSAAQLALFNRIFCREKHEFDSHYVQKIRGEFEWSKFVAKNTKKVNRPRSIIPRNDRRNASSSPGSGLVSEVNEETLGAVAQLFSDDS